MFFIFFLNLFSSVGPWDLWTSLPTYPTFLSSSYTNSRKCNKLSRKCTPKFTLPIFIYPPNPNIVLEYNHSFFFFFQYIFHFFIHRGVFERKIYCTGYKSLNVCFKKKKRKRRRREKKNRAINFKILRFRNELIYSQINHLWMYIYLFIYFICWYNDLSVRVNVRGSIMPWNKKEKKEKSCEKIIRM